jgi:drug/metabolite transporter (DMT)-like permease
VSGVAWAAISGVGFGVFQTVNARAVRLLDDPYVSTLVQVLMAASVLSVAWLASGDVTAVGDAPLWALLSFAAAGVFHFIGGWSLLNLSQRRIGAARTSPLLTMSPLFGVAIAALTLGELPGAVALAGVALMVAGAWMVSRPEEGGRARLGDSVFGIGTALMWAISPVFAVHGLEGLDSPLAALVIGLWSSALLAGAGLVVFDRGARLLAVGRGGLLFQMGAGLLVALASWGRWVALDFAAVGVVLGLGLLSVPTVLVLATVLGRRPHGAVWVGAGMVLAGALVVIGVDA